MTDTQAESQADDTGADICGKLIRSLPVAVLRFDPLLEQCLYVNPFWTVLTGQSAAAALGQGYLACVHAGDISIFRQYQQRCLTQSIEDRDDSIELRILNSNTHVIRVVINHAREPDSSAKSAGLILTVSKIPDADQSPVKPEHTPPAVSDILWMNKNVPGMICRYVVKADGTHVITYASDQCRVLFELQPEEIVSDINHLFERIHPDDKAQVAGALKESLMKLELFKQEYRVILPLSGVRWLQSIGQPARFESGDTVWDTVAIDITDRKLAQQALQDAQIQLNRITENIPGMIFRFESLAAGDYQVTYVSPQCEQLFELEISQIPEKGVRFLERVHKQDLPGVLEEISRSADSLQAFKHEFRLVLPKQGIRWRQAIGQPSRMESGNIVWDGVVIDITQRKQAEAELKRANEELSQLTRAKDRFLANMSHELRTPLSAILSTNEGLQQGVYGDVNEKQVSCYRTIEESGSHLLGLINDVLDLAKIESGSFSMECAPVDVVDVCKSSINLIVQQARLKSIALELIVSEGLPVLVADHKRVVQILVNLLSNAIKFTPENGKVTVEVCLAERLEGDRCEAMQFQVTDTGIGIEDWQLKLLFEPFFQADTALNRRFEGTGLGLALVKELTDLHAGRVVVNSTPGQGSTFTVCLPLVQNNVKTDDAPFSRLSDPEKEPNTKVSVKGAIVLLAEDNQQVAAPAVRFLESSDFTVCLAGDGVEAISVALRERPDVILMDVQMPGMDGLEAIRQLRGIPEFVKTPIIALTGRAMQDDAEKCLAAGANIHLSKPFAMKDLVDCIERFIDGRQSL